LIKIENNEVFQRGKLSIIGCLDYLCTLVIRRSSLVVVVKTVKR